MGSENLLFNPEGKAMTPDEIREKIAPFRYKKATQEIIGRSKGLDKDGKVFVECTARILSSFGMTRSGPFKGVGIASNGNVNGKEILLECWKEIGDDLITIRNSVRQDGYSSDRYLLELSSVDRERLIAQIWAMTKRLLPFTIGKTTYGLVGASKILFAVLPEIVLPVDNQQWRELFKTVDLGDIIHRMTDDIKQWEDVTKHKLNEVDRFHKLTTLPSVYNVITMDAKSKLNHQ
ncbi:hypothetical protein ACFL0Q_03040 [Thermodesulfobacteriota bacterium]